MTDALHDTISGDRGLQIEEPLIFEQDSPGALGVDWPQVEARTERLGGLARAGAIGLPSLAEPTVVRHYTRLSQKNYGIDTGLFPLGSCTMKHNPRLNERLARLPGFADLHPLQPESTVQGALRLCRELQRWLTALTGMPCVALTPGAGAHGELCGMMAIRAALDARGEDSPARRRVLVPDSAHGTNPATAAALGFQVVSIPEDTRGRVDPARFEALLEDGIAAVMLTNPNTCGVFENDIRRIAAAVHEAGGYFYCDGANFNAIVGRVRPGDLGIDAMHLNLHKTFSTPHGGGGPGAGPVVFSEALAPYAPVPRIVEAENGLLRLEETNSTAFGRMKAFHGQMGMFVRALAYLMSHGADGLRQVSGDAVLNANYVLRRLEGAFSAPFAHAGAAMHEALFDDRSLRDSGVTTLDIAKAMIDEGLHPMTIYFPLVVHGAMLVEPTETETRASLDRFIVIMRGLAEQAKDGAVLSAAPHHAPRRRLDETRAARRPVLRWRPAGDAESDISDA